MPSPEQQRVRLIDEDAEEKIAGIVAAMTLEEKIGQMFQPNWRCFRPAFWRFLSGMTRGFSPDGFLNKMSYFLSPTDSGPLDPPAAVAVTKHALGSVLGDGGAAPEPNVAAKWREQADTLQAAASRMPSKVPLLIGNDSVHGQANLKDATLFPHHIGQGCMRDAKGAPDTDLVEALARVAARETAACGVNWAFSPCVAVPQDLRWGRLYEGFSEDVSIVAALGAAEVRGLQNAGVPMAACLKHWVGDGGTQYGSGTHLFFWTGAPTGVLDQGDCRVDEATLRSQHIAAYLPALDAGCLTVMASYSSYQGEKLHVHRRLITEVLKGELGFEGLVVSDYNAINHLQLQTNPPAPAREPPPSAGARGSAPCDGSFLDAFSRTVNAGVDMIMTAGGLIGFAKDLPYDAQVQVGVQAVTSGRVPVARVDDAVTRILRVKAALGLLPFTGSGAAEGRPLPPIPEIAIPEIRTSLADCVGCSAHRALARTAVAKSLVLLKNEHAALPLSRDQAAREAVMVTGGAADDLGMQCGGWSFTWQGQRGNGFTQGTTLWQGIRAACGEGARLVLPDELWRDRWLSAFRGPPPLGRAATVVVVVGETPYAEGGGDTREAKLSASDEALIRHVAGGGRKVVVVVLSGRPLVIPTATLALIDALVAAWLPGTEGNGVADVLFGAVEPTGKLGFAWPKACGQMEASARAAPGQALFPRGHGLTYQHHQELL